jgi:hypothetical protein
MNKRNTLQLTISEKEQQQLDAIASELDCFWGGKSSKTELLRQIAHRRFKVVKPSDLNSWAATEILKLITHRTPFRLSYVDAAGRPFIFTARYAEVTERENRQYLECWCDETEMNQDLLELQHNWCLRFDRIPEEGASITPLEPETWREGMAIIPAQFELYGGLAHAYALRKGDRIDNWDGKVKTVTRQITSTFWFIREIIRYGKDCKVLSPDGVRDRLVEQLEGAIAHYRPSQYPGTDSGAKI